MSLNHAYTSERLEFSFLLVLFEIKHMAEQPGTGSELSPDPAAQQGGASLPKKDRQEGVVSKGIEENACAAGAGALLSGRFQLIECVGAGGMSTVYKALDRHDAPDRYIAVKVLNRRFQTDPQRLAALQQEADCCQRILHPNIVRAYGFHRDGSTAYMTMEYLSGEPLTARIRSESFVGMSAHEALPIINAMGQALDYAHSRGIVHCDFKPTNVFLTDAGEIKLIDFGIAHPFAQREDAAPEDKGELRPFAALSPVYASPDILEGRDPDPRDDVYSLACTAYELLTGVHPFAYQPALEAREAGLAVERRRGLSYRQWEALRGALAFDRSKRTPTAERFLSELNGVGLIGRAKPSHLAAGVVACLLVAVGGMLASRSSAPPPVGAPPALTPKTDSSKSGSVADSGHDILILSEPVLVDERGDSETPVTTGLVSAPENEGRLETPSIQQALPTEATPREKHSVPRSPAKPIEPGQKAVSSATTQRVGALLVQAERQMAAKRLTTPVGDAAFESYEQVLKLIPGYEGALEGITRIKEEYKLWAEADKRRGNWKRAEASLEKALAIDPEDAILPGALRELREAQKREQELPPLVQLEIARPKGKRRTQVNVWALATLNQAGGEIIITERECPNDPRGNFAVSTAVNQAIRYTGCAVRSDQDRLVIQWNNGTVSAHSITEFAPSEAGFGARSSPDDLRFEDPMARPVSRFEEFERRMGILR